MFQRPQNINSDTYVLDATNTTSATALDVKYNPQGNLIIYNSSSTVAVFVTCSQGSGTAVFPTSSNDPKAGKVIPPGAMVTFEKNAEHNYLNCITASGTATVYVSVGTGL